MTTPKLDIRRANDRFHTQIGWLDSRHSFSFSHHYDPRNTHHGLLLVSNDDVIKAGSGFDTHPHRDMEIVTWVLRGELEHKDSQGNRGIIYPGLAQRMSAGTGIWHSEMNPAPIAKNARTGDSYHLDTTTESGGTDHGKRGGVNPKIEPGDVHLVQMWVIPDKESVNPGYEQLDINPQLEKGGLVPIASGRGHNAAIKIRQAGAVLWGGRLKGGQTIQIPDAAFAHLFVASGSATLEGAGTLSAGDAVRLTGAGSPKLTADAKTGAEVLIWEMANKIPEGIY